jgi:hypothetical protein
VVLDVVAVVEEQEVVQPAVVADRAARVLVVAVQPAQRQAGRIAGQVGREEESGVTHDQ